MGPGCRAYRFGVRRLGFRVMCASCLRSHISGLSFRDMAPLCFHLHERYSHCRRSLLTSCDVGCFTCSNDTRKHNLRHVDTRKHSLRYIDRCTQWPELPCAESQSYSLGMDDFGVMAQLKSLPTCYATRWSQVYVLAMCFVLGFCPGYQDSGELFLKSLLQILAYVLDTRTLGSYF